MGPAAVNFANSSAANTSVQFTTPGTYILRLTIRDGRSQGYDEVTINVLPEPIAYTRPVVFAGPDQTIQLPSSASLTGGYTLSPVAPSGAAITWTLTTGPAAVNFTDSSAADTAVHFTTPGVYVLRMTVRDGQSQGYDEITVTVTEAPASAPKSRVGQSFRKR